MRAGIPKDAIRWVPALDMPYKAPTEGADCGGSYVEGGLSEWVQAMNTFYQQGLQEILIAVNHFPVIVPTS